MDEKRLARSPIGNLVNAAGFDGRFDEEYRCQAFLPHPLPLSPELSGATYAAVIRASSAIARADEAIKLLPNPTLLVRPAIRREAVSTSALEGTYAALEDVLASDFLDDKDLDAPVREVRNYVRAAEEAITWIRDRPFTMGILEHLQGIIVKDTRSGGPEAGKLRTTQVFIGAENKRIAEARFVPVPPGDHLRDGINTWLQWVNETRDVPVVVRSALAHYQFETLHPFADGNGRLGRLIAILQLVKSNELHAPVINISPWLEPRRADYQNQLFELSATGDWNAWVTFFSTALEAQSLDAAQRVSSLRILQQSFIDQVKAAKVKGASLDIARDLIGYPVINVAAAARIANVSFQAANQAVARLCDIGLLKQLGTGRYDRLFLCQEVLTVVQ